MLVGQGSPAAEEPSIRQSADGDPGCHQDSIAVPVSNGVCGGQRYDLDVCAWPAKLPQSCLTLCNPVDCSLTGSCVHGTLQVRILEWVAMFSSRGSSRPGESSLLLLGFLRLEAGSLPLAPLRKPVT